MSSAYGSRRNMFCDRDVLGNEASVETFFVNRLLTELGYRDEHIRTKESLETLKVNQGRQRKLYRPDYALEVDNTVRWILEAKAVDESLTPFVGQAASYCHQINASHRDGNPVTHFIMTNGVSTEIYEWDRQDPILSLSFKDFDGVSSKWAKLKEIMAPDSFASARWAAQPALFDSTIEIRRASISEINAAFAWCHKFIYRRENYSYSAAFMEFVKVVFLKLLSDKAAHANPGVTVLENGSLQVPAEEVKFSTAWIEKMEGESPNPVADVQFNNLVRQLEEEIRQRKKKRIFGQGEILDLSPETIKGVVAKLQDLDLYSMDSDLNGRLFETFLNATLRGKDLGQFFTPRSVVKLATSLADLQVRRDHVETVIDACCGTGGFLIESLADMWGKVDGNKSLSASEKVRLRDEIATQRIYGIDVAKEPALARIARINMYLHGDGGSRVYQLDALDKRVRSYATETREVRDEKEEFKGIADRSGFDVALTNPPFAKEYARKTDVERQILDQYELAFMDSGRTRKPVSSLKSSMMFIERYHDLLRPGGRLVTVIDDSILGGDREKRIRSYIRDKFIVKAVVSLPGDAFQRSQARVKTSVVVLQKKHHAEEEQTPIFMYYCTRVGIDEVARQRVLPIDEENRRAAEAEIDKVGKLYRDFLNGNPDEAWIVSPEAIEGRMDVKACLPSAGRNVERWREEGHEVLGVGQMLKLAFGGAEFATSEEDSVDRASDVVIPADSEELVTLLRVRYDGTAEPGETIAASDSTYDVLYKVRAGDVVISHINAVHGAVAVIPEELEGLVATKEYTVCRPRKGYHPYLIWQMLRTPEARADLLLSSTGMGRTRVDWPIVSQLQLPVPSMQISEAAIKAVEDARALERKAQELYVTAAKTLGSSLNLDNTEARALLAAFKPPR
ncbi:N-6 DNA methylase [Streptomyces sp. NRRL F-5630]|uniref:N-6 DNA methylase n=1 Tax=Streptomyces sp. NRRL F-5630 TaxID=1463864 RepID=UPI003D7421BB